MKPTRTNFILLAIVIMGFCFIGFGVVSALYAKSGFITSQESANCVQIERTIMNVNHNNPSLRPLDSYEICKEGYVKLHVIQSFRWAVIGALSVIATLITKKFFFQSI